MTSSFSATQARALFVPSDKQGGYFYRSLNPSNTLQKSGYAHTLCHHMTYDLKSIKTLNPDIIVFQHPSTDAEIQTLRSYRKALPSSHFVYDIDDNFFAVPDESVHKAHLPKDIKARIVTAANLCNSITVATEPLAKVMREATNVKDIRILPNYIPEDALKVMASTRRKTRTEGRKPRVGWVGGIGHSGDIKLLEDILYKLHDTVDWVFMGMMPENCDRSMFEVHEAVSIEHYHQKLASLDLDIALAPLADNAFNESKSNLRVLEYGAAGFAVLASDVAPYRTIENARLLPFVSGVWESAIRELVANPELINEMAEKLHEEVANKWCLDKHHELISHRLFPKVHKFHKPHHVEKSENVVEFCTSFDATIGTHPKADVLWNASGAKTDFDANEISSRSPSGCGSVSVMSNDGLYPISGQFSPLGEDVVSFIREAQKLSGNAEFLNIPHPIGPSVLLKAPVLARIGAPDIKRFPNRAAALMDWGARAMAAGFSHDLLTTEFAFATEQDSKEETREQVAAANGWNPFFVKHMQQSKHVEAIDFAAQNIELMLNHLHYQHPLTNTSYEDWFKIHNFVSPQSIKNICDDIESWETKPLISIIMPVYNPSVDELRAAIASVESQIYENWELLIVNDASTDQDIAAELNEAAGRDPRIKVLHRAENGHICTASNDALEMAAGEWVACVDHDDIIEPHALYMIAKEIFADPNVKFIYSDSDKISPDGKLVDPYFPSDFNYDLLLAQNYVTHLSAYRLEIVKAIGGYRKGYEGSQDWDMTLRYLTQINAIPGTGNGIKHIPHVLYHWRQSANSVALNMASKPYARESGYRAVLEHLKDTKQTCAVLPHPIVPVFNMVRYLLPEKHPKVSIIIQTRDNADQLANCVNSILEKTAYSDYEIIVLDNGWRKDALKKVKKNDKVVLYSNPGEFNYAAANNKGAELASGEYLCFLNDDTQIVEPAWLLDLVGVAARSWTGAVGPRLLYADGTVQQAGTIIDMTAPGGQKALHGFQKQPTQHPGTVGRGVLASEWSAVTGACMVISKAKYLEMNGMDAEAFPRDFNDVDLCLRLHKAGYRNVGVNHIIVLHFEGQSKKKDKKTFTMEALNESESILVERHGDFIDPYRNPNLMHFPSQEILNQKPPELAFNKAIEFDRAIIINADHNMAVSLYQDGVLAFCTTLSGHDMQFTYPRMDRVSILDTRDSSADLLYIMHMLNIKKIVLNGVGNGTYGILGFLQDAEKYGAEIFYNYAEGGKEENLPEEIKAYLWAKAKKLDLNAD